MQASIQLGDLKDPQNVKKLEALLSELYDLFDPLYETSDPNGSVSAQRGKIAIYYDGADYQKKINVDGGTTWLPIGGFVDRGDPAAYDRQVGDFTVDSDWHDWDLSAIVPAGAKAVLLRVMMKDDLVERLIQFQKNGNTNTFNSTHIRAQVANVYIEQDLIVACDSDRVIEYYLTTGMDACNVIVRGWWF